MKSYEKIKEMLCEELENIAKKGELTAGSLDTVDKLTHAIKSLETIIAMNEYSEDGYSNRGSYDGNMNSNSYARRYTREGSSADCTKLWKKLRTSRQNRKYANL